MLALDLARPGKALRVLALGAHSDDIEIGAGGAILSWIASGAEVSVDWCALSAPGERADEARASAMEFWLAPRARTFISASFEMATSAERTAVKDWVEGLKRLEKPDVVLCHQRNDAHQDHRHGVRTGMEHVPRSPDPRIRNSEVGRRSWAAKRLCAAERRGAREEIELLHKHFGTQRSKAWFDDETFRGLARLRGVECRERYAEGFSRANFC